MTKKVVYISSTYVDLKEHRQRVIEFFGKKTVKENFDLISMEGYVADNNVPLDECLEDVKRCNIFILIVARRYGYIHFDPEKNPDKLSITELEYNTATSDPNKTILCYFADELDPGLEEDMNEDESTLAYKRQHLSIFKNRVRVTKLLASEPFTNPYHLALQISESLMQKSFIPHNMIDARKFCCDRVPQMTNYKLACYKGRFHSIIICGNRKELGHNLINRISLFALGLKEEDLPPYESFEDILFSESYEQNKLGLLVRLNDRFLSEFNRAESALESFLTSLKNSDKPLVFTIDCHVDFFEERQISFLQIFMEEFYRESMKNPGPGIYLFFYLEENEKDGKAEQKIKKLQQKLNNQEHYLCVMPKLQSLSSKQIESWLFEYITRDEEEVIDIMDKYFNDLPSPLTMHETEKKIGSFIQKFNSCESIRQLITT